MKLEFDFTLLGQLAARMGKPVSFILPKRGLNFEPLDIELEHGVEIDFKKIKICSDLLDLDGRQVVIYIKDHSYGNIFKEALRDPAKGNKFHVAYCQTLEEMEKSKRFKRYHALNSVYKYFKIFSNNYPGEEPEVKLQVCQNCLKLLNYKGSRESSQSCRRNAQEFNRKIFFSTYSSVFSHLPMSMADDRVGYTDDWAIVSRRVREEYNYQCQECGINLYKHKNLCHTHHINGVKSDNNRSNLRVLCADCHRKAHNGALFVPHNNMQIITRLRREQARLKQGQWSDIYKYSDPAIHGELSLLERQGFNAPEIGYQVQNEHGAIICELEVAWPDRQQAIMIKRPKALPEILNNWKVFELGELSRLIN